MRLVQDSQTAPQPPEGTPPDRVGSPDQAQPVDESTAQPSQAQSDPAPVATGPSGVSGGLVAVGILIALCLAGGLFVLLVRRKLLTSGSDEEGTNSLMDSMRAMLRRGEITQEEFDAARRSMVARLSQKSGPRPGARGGGEQPG